MHNNSPAYFILYPDCGFSVHSIQEKVFDWMTDEYYYAILDLLFGLAHTDPISNARYVYYHGDTAQGNVFMKLESKQFLLGDYGNSMYLDKQTHKCFSVR